MENQEKQHKRRVRYSGTHPKSYKEKYKEHNPEKYADTIERVIQKGGTCLRTKGRVAILTFHSGEDRLVKRSFKHLQDAGFYSEICKDVIRSSAEECARNSRAKSTKMCWAIRA